MPWRHVFEPNPSDSSLPVHKSPPGGFEILGGWGGFKTARFPFDKVIELANNKQEWDEREFYHCRNCDGWIEGKPYEYKENSMGILCGRRGTTSSCNRCGDELGFSGMVS